MKRFKDLSEVEMATYQRWARDHYEPFQDIKGKWHYVTQGECIRMNIEENDKMEKEK